MNKKKKIYRLTDWLTDRLTNNFTAKSGYSFIHNYGLQAFLLKEVLSDMFPEMTPEFEKAAKNISKSRIMANVHYESDKSTGEKLGMDLYNHYKTI